MTVIQPGIHASMTNDAYHAETEHWSSSRLKAALPEHYRTGGSSDALAFGSLVHEVVLEPETLDRYVPLDAVKIGVKSDGTVAQSPTMTAAWKRAVAEVEADGKTVVALDDWDRAHRMADALRKHGAARELLFEGIGRNEVSAFARTDKGVPIKARFDRIVANVAIDLKTTAAKPGEHSLTRTVIDYGYDLSAAHYLDVADRLDLGLDGFTWIFVGKADPYRVTVADASPDFLERGRILRDLALSRLTDPSVEPYEGATGRLTLWPPMWATDGILPDLEMEIA